MDWSDHELLVTIGRNLTAERKRRGLTQEQVAQRINMSMQQYSRIERGEHDTGITKYVRAADAIEMPLIELFRGLTEASG